MHSGRVKTSSSLGADEGGFPRVRAIALRILSVGAVSFEPESLFSDPKFTVKARQTNMKPKHVNARICLKRWVLAGLIEKRLLEPKLPSKIIKSRYKVKRE